MFEVGEEAPDFTLPDGDGAPVSLRDLRGRPVVVYFYPRDDTPGCTTQACGIRDAWAEFEDLGAAVLGISPDGPESHARFRDKYDLPHTLLADTDAAVIRSYGAWGRVRYRDKEYDGVIRMTVLIDGNGRVARIWPKVNPDEHAEDVLAAIHDLEPTG